MGLLAKRDFPRIQFRNSVMVGDSITDMIFGKRLNMQTVLIDANCDIARAFHRMIDRRYHSLKEFATYIVQHCK